MKVCVLICAYRRPALLAILLQSLREQEFKAASPEIRIIVVDNDAARSSHGVVERFADSGGPGCSYGCMPEGGIPQARNMCLDMVDEDADLVAFIDDDERAAPDWLEGLLSMRGKSGAEVVSGPVLPDYPLDTPPWIVRQGMFERRNHEDGAAIRYCSTNNVLADWKFIRDRGFRFDERYTDSGGSDVKFFMEVAEAGGRMVWAKEAVVFERVLPQRARAGWLLGRSFRLGNSLMFCFLHQYGIGPRLFRRLAVSCAQLALGLAALLPFALLGFGSAVRAARLACKGAGGLAALAGCKYREYRK